MVHAQESWERPTTSATRIPSSAARPSIDGVLDERVWAEAPPLAGLRQAVPVEFGDPSEETEVRILYDDESIFIGVTCFDSAPDRIMNTVRERDVRLATDDNLSIVFDPLQTQINGYLFGIGAGGSRADGAITDGRANININYEWFGRTQVNEEGWVAEIEIPWSEFNFDPKLTTWGFNFERFIARKNETIRWSAPLARVRNAQTAFAGRLAGLDEIQKGLALDLKPFVVGRHTNDRSTGEAEDDLEVGIDVFYKLTPNTKLSLSVNPDFAEAEVDDRLVNLTRFPLFLPERRPFFLEDAGIFTFGPPIRPSSTFRNPPSIDVIPYFSRRIGLSPLGQPVPINYAAKLTSENESFRYGVLATETGETEILDEQGLAVARFSKKLFEQSDVGVIGTYGDPQDRGREGTFGIDLNLRSTSFLDDKNLNFSAWVLRTATEDVDDEQGSYQVAASYPNDTVNLFSSYTVVEDNFDPAIGFVQRYGHKFQNSFAWRPRPHNFVRQYDFRVEPNLVTNNDGETETVFVLYRPFGVEFESGDEITIDIEQSKEVLDQPFPIHPGVIIPVGTYEFVRGGLALQSNERRPFEAFGSVFGGEFFDGDRIDYIAGINLRTPGVVSLLGLEYNFNDVHLPAGDFTVSLARLKLDLQFGRQLTWSNYVQWDNRTELLGLNSRFRWFVADGRELHFVVNQGWNYDSRTITTQDTEVILKVSYLVKL